nr:uncharacterized protein LOC128703798 isoform X1 [Cherax quadricarinatus]
MLLLELCSSISTMKSAVLVVMLVVLQGCSSQVLNLPLFTEEEKNFYLNHISEVVDCLVDATKTDCHEATHRIRSLLPELVRRNFKCQCDAQKDVDLFVSIISKPENAAYNRKLAAYINEHVNR